MSRCVPCLVLALSAVALAIPAVTGAANPSGDPSSEENPTLLFVQDAKSGSLVPIAKRPGKYRLTLRGVHPRTRWFENRPGDFKGTVPNQQMLNIFPVRQHVVMGVKMLDAKWNRKTRTLRYRVVRLLDRPKRPGSKFGKKHVAVDAVLPRRFDETAVFIDDARGQLAADIYTGV